MLLTFGVLYLAWLPHHPTDVATLQQQLVANDGEGADEASPRKKVKVVNNDNVSECAVSKEEQCKEVVGPNNKTTDSLALVQDQKREGKYFEFVFKSGGTAASFATEQHYLQDICKLRDMLVETFSNRGCNTSKST